MFRQWSEARRVRRLAMAGDPDSQYEMGLMCFFGDTVPEDRREAAGWYRLAAEQGHTKAQNNLGYSLSNGYGVAQDRTEAAGWFRKAAERGDMYARHNMGWACSEWGGVTRDYAEAARWYRLSAEQGFEKSQRALGAMLLEGRGVAQDYAEAAEWFRKAAERGDRKAQCDLGVMHLEGRGVAQDDAEAWKWLAAAAAQGVGAAQHRLSQMYKGGRAERPRRKEAGGSVVGKLRRGMLHELLDTAREALRGEDYPKARFILCVILNPWNSRPSLSQSPVTQAAWVMYADACLGLCYYDEAERVYGICADLCIQRGHAQERLEATATRRAGQRTPRVICDHEELRSILESVLPCFPWIEKDIMAFVVRGQRDLDDCLANRAGIKDRILLDKSELAFCTYGNPEAFVIVFKEEMLKKKMFKRQYTASGRVGVCAHELSHCSLSSGMAITDVCGRLDATTYRDVCRTLSDRMYSPSGGYCVSCNEYLTDAAAISRGFAFELLGVMDPDRNGAYMGYETVLSWWSV